MSKHGIHQMTDADYVLTAKLATLVISVLNGLSQGQGHASVSVFDAGVGGGFQNGSITICIERDGAVFDKRFFSEDELVDTLSSALEYSGGLPYRRALRKFAELMEDFDE